SAQPSAVATVGKRVESISPADSGSRAVATDDAGAPGDGASDAPEHPPPTDAPPIDAAFGDSPPATAAKAAPPRPVVPDEAAG
ncbi:MAG TPA: hypothetical protein VK601_18300, partial [Kofleriaceae bacterium]|nr:hypothetical protein [Kofleriaceae bacterium]